MSSNKVLTASLLALTTFSTAAPALAQSQGFEGFRREMGRALTSRPRVEESSPTRGSQAVPTDYHFKNRKDRVEWAKAKSVAEKSTGFRVIVSLQERHLWVVTEEDTLLSAPVAVAKGNTVSYAGREFTFETPRGMRRVLGKDADPIWNPPDWLYIETAQEHGLKVGRIPVNGSVTTSDGRKLVVRGNRVAVIDDEGLSEFPPELHIIFGETLYIPPLGTDNRRVNGTLGKYKLSLGDGYMLHGTPHQNSIGMAATHGCVRLRDEDIEWLYENVPVGTKVYIY